MKKKILMMLPTPPPIMGPSIATNIILESEIKNKYDIIFIDTADRRDLTNLGSIDLQNVLLALKHYLFLLIKILSKKPDIVYFLIAVPSRMSAY